MKKIVKSIYGNLYLDAVDQLGLTYRVEDKEKSLVYISNGKKEMRLQSHNLRLNPPASRTNTKHKGTTSKLLSEKNIPVPIFTLFDNTSEVIEHASAKVMTGLPIVIKPNTGSNAQGIRINPTSQAHIKEAVKEAFDDSKEIVVEDYIPGNHYRITILDDEIIAVTQRTPAYVTGDGTHTVDELIDLKNTIRKERKLPLIHLREMDHHYLETVDIDLSHIYPEGENIILQSGCDFDIGGERVKIDVSLVPKLNKKMFIKAVRTLGLRFGGVDYISPDITIKYTQIHTAINEINSSPHQDVHYYDSYPPNNYSAKRIIQKIFELK